MLGQAENEIAVDGRSLVGWHVLVVKFWDLVHVSELTKGAKEIIGRDGGLALEEGEPEDLNVDEAQTVAHFFGQIVVHDVLEVDFVEIVSPWMQYGETLVLDALLAVLLNVLPEELEACLIGRDRVAQVILDNWLLSIADERSDGLDARA